MALLDVRNVVSGYGETDILHGVSIHVDEGEFVTIIGPNGSGKSTLMKTIFGLLKPSSGNVDYDHMDITGMPTDAMVRMGLSYVPQTSNVFASLTIRENLEMGAFVDDSDITGRTEVMFELFPDLRGRQGQKAGTLSGGQRQMLAFARAMMLEPRLLLLDEPSAGLSPLMTEAIFDRLGYINDSGIAILVVEQNARASLALSDRGYVMANGENRLEGEGRSVLENADVGRLYLGA